MMNPFPYEKIYDEEKERYNYIAKFGEDDQHELKITVRSLWSGYDSIMFKVNGKLNVMTGACGGYKNVLRLYDNILAASMDHLGSVSPNLFGFEISETTKSAYGKKSLVFYRKLLTSEKWLGSARTAGYSLIGERLQRNLLTPVNHIFLYKRLDYNPTYEEFIEEAETEKKKYRRRKLWEKFDGFVQDPAYTVTREDRARLLRKLDEQKEKDEK